MNKTTFAAVFAVVAAAAFSSASYAQSQASRVELPPVQSATAPHYLNLELPAGTATTSVALAPIPSAQAPHQVQVSDTQYAQTGSVAGR